MCFEHIFVDETYAQDLWIKKERKKEKTNEIINDLRFSVIGTKMFDGKECALEHRIMTRKKTSFF